MSVSDQGSRLVSRSPIIADAHFRAEADPYHPERNPEGYVNLGTAENRLVRDLLAPRLHAPRQVTAEDTGYAPLHGTAALRRAIATSLSRCWHADVDPEDLIVVSGATAALDVIASTLCDPGQAIIVPAPYYAAFDTDLCGRSGARLIPVPSAASAGFQLDPLAVDQVLTETQRHGVVVRAIAVTSPGNPVGHVHPPGALRMLLDVARRNGLDLICDEIYAHSVFGPEAFVSVRDPLIRGTGGADGTHVIWGFAKDFALPGLKVGVLHTVNPQIKAGARAFAYFAPVSADTQHLLHELLTDQEWADSFIDQNRRRLGLAYSFAAHELAERGIPHIPVSSGFSLWIDLGGWLPARTFAAEDALWRHILDSGRVNVLPGGAFGCSEAGWFRLCYATEPRLVREGITRIERLLATRGSWQQIAQSVAFGRKRMRRGIPQWSSAEGELA